MKSMRIVSLTQLLTEANNRKESSKHLLYMHISLINDSTLRCANVKYIFIHM